MDVLATIVSDGANRYEYGKWTMLRGDTPSVFTFASLADDEPRGSVVAPPDEPADCVAGRPEAPCHRFTDNDHGPGVRPVGGVEVGAPDDIDTCRLEAPRLDLDPVRDEGAVVGRRLERVDVEVARALAERVQVQVDDGVDRLDAGERPEAIQEAPRVDARVVGREPGRQR